MTILKKNFRVISRLDIKRQHLVKGVQLEGLRKVGEPNYFAHKYYDQGIDEILYMDIVASLYNRNSLIDLVEETTKNVFVPITVGGGLKSINDVEQALSCGADKIAINTAALKTPKLLDEIASNFGSQCLVLSIEAKRLNMEAKWECYYDNGREHTGLDVLDWFNEAQDRGVGELLITSVDKEGRRQGMDLDLLANVSNLSKVPVIASGGVGSVSDIVQAAETGVDAIALAHVLHYDEISIADAKKVLSQSNLLEVRI